MGNAGNGYIFAGGDFQRTYPMTRVFRWNPSTGDLQVYCNGWKSITVGGGGGGTEYTAGNGISIVNASISVDTSEVALKSELFSGSYNDLTNKPTIPTKTSQLTNDSGFITSAPVTSVNGQTGAVNITIPTMTSQLTNNSGFVTQIYVDGLVGDTNSILNNINGKVI